MSKDHHHHILSNKAALTVGGILLFMTVVTVWIAQVDLGAFNFIVAMLVASIKAALVAFIFMNLWYDRKENSVIFLTSFLFLAIFIALTATDIFFRGDVYWDMKKGLPTIAQKGGPAKFKKPWLATPELVSHGREQYQAQCVSCHGPGGKGDGAAAASMNPKPRNFTATEGWKNGRKPSDVFRTLRDGIPGTSMASFATLPAEDRWALSHYVLSLGPPAPADAPADLAKVGVDPTKDTVGGAAEEAPSIPVDFAIQRMVEEAGR